MTRLRCWPGCLAVIVKDDCAENLGAVVEVLKRADSADYFPGVFNGEEWEVMPTRPLKCWGIGGFRLGQFRVAMLDMALRPITPPPGTSETATDTPADAVAA